jgi:hypothetical protein
MTTRAESVIVSSIIAILGALALGIKAVDAISALRRRPIIDTQTNGGARTQDVWSGTSR